MKWNLTTAIMLISAIGIAISMGYLAGHMVYSPKTDDLEDQVHHLESEVSGLEESVSGKEADISTLENTVSIQQDTVSEREDTITTQQDEILSLSQQIAALVSSRSSILEQLGQANEQISVRDEQLSDLQDYLDSIIITHHYTWHYQIRYWNLDLPISMLDYIESKERARATEWSSYVDVVKDTKDDSYIYQVVSRLNEIVSERNLTETETLDLVVSFVVGLPYVVSDMTAPYDASPRYPIETLFEREGDSEDTSILVAALLYRMGFDVALIILEDDAHMAVGVSLVGYGGSYYEYDGKRYYYLETTSLVWGVGVVPPLFAGSNAQVLPLSN